MSDNFNDKFLIAGSLAGDEQAFGKLYDKYVDEIYRFIAMRVRTKEQAQDLTSEMFLRAWQYISQPDKKIDNIRALFYRIARNLVIDHYRESGKELTSIDDELFKSMPDKSLNLAKDAEFKDEIRQTLEVVYKLPKDQRELILMKYVQDLSIKEIAQILEKKPGSVRVALHRAINQLKGILKGKD